jgi:hypothetical protein
VQPPLLRPSIPMNPNIHRKGNTRFWEIFENILSIYSI